MGEDKNIISEAGGSGNSAAGEPPTAFAASPMPHARDNVPSIQQTRAAAPSPPVKCPCEEKIDGKLCRKESDSMTALGKLLCPAHREAYETKWGIKVGRLESRMPCAP